MSMANGNTTQDKRMAFKPRKSTTDNHPDAPEGKWEFVIPKGKCKVKVTQKGDPQLIIPHKLVEADDPKNESHQGSEVAQRVIFFDEADPERLKASNMSKDRLRALCKAVDVEFADVYPTEIENEHSFDNLIRALEGKGGTCWTVHTTRPMGDSNEMITDTEIRYREPGAGLVTKGADSDDDDRPGARKASKKGGKR